MPLSNEEWGFWRWFAATAGSVLLGLLGGTWAASRKVTMLEAKEAMQDDRLDAFDRFRTDQITFCARQKDDLLAALQKEICNIVKIAIKDLLLDQKDRVASLDKNIALIAQSHEQMEKHIEEIFNRLNRRDTDHNPGQDRRHRE